MKTLLVSEFKTHCVGVLNEVADYGEEVIVTKRGKPLARIVPIAPSQTGKRAVGDCAKTATIHTDIVHSDDSDDWEALDS
jgi:prevent-host-death family protein